MGDGARVVPPNALPGLDRDAGVIVLGAGKTAMDAVQWLLDAGDDPGAITWVRPRDPWLLNRRYIQPLDLVGWFLEGQARCTEAVADATDLADLARRLEEAEQLIRLDRRVEPTMYRCATVLDSEVADIARVERVVRAGRVRRVDPGSVTLEDATLARARGDVVVDCTCVGLRDAPAAPVFAPGRVTVQQVRSCSPSLNAALTGFVEALEADDDERNRLCPPHPYPSTTRGWLAGFAANGRTQSRWGRDPRVLEWLGGCRLDVTCGAVARLDTPMVAGAIERIVARGREARVNGERLLAESA